MQKLVGCVEEERETAGEEAPISKPSLGLESSETDDYSTFLCPPSVRLLLAREGASAIRRFTSQFARLCKPRLSAAALQQLQMRAGAAGPAAGPAGWQCNFRRTAAAAAPHGVGRPRL